MDIAKKTKITNTRQFSRMVSLLEQNPCLARGFSSGINKINVKEWNKFGEELNILGPPTRNGEGWLKVWADFKFKVKKKLIHNKAECRATGGGSFKQFVLSPTEEAASNLLQIDTIVNPGGVAFGAQRRNENSDNVENVPMSVNLEIEQPVCSNQSKKTKQNYIGPKEVRSLHSTQKHASKTLIQSNDVEEVRTSQLTKKTSTQKPTQNYEILGESSLTTSTKTSTKKKTKDDILEEQLNVQTALYKEVMHSLAEIERYQHKNFKLKEEKLALYKEELKCKEEFRRELLKLRKEEIELEQRGIAIDEIRKKKIRKRKILKYNWK